MSNVSGQMKRVQYKTNENVASSLTIEPLLYSALEKKFGDANSWCKKKALEVRAQLAEEALELQKIGQLTKIDNFANVKEMTVDEYVKGKVSGGIRTAACLEIIDKRYL